MERALTYKFVFGDGSQWEHTFSFDSRGNLKSKNVEHAKDWTALGYQQCSNCPLNPEVSPHCPVALQLADLVEDSKSCRSVTEALVTVKTPERDYSRYCHAHEGLRSIFGLIMATSGCPHFEWLKPLARFHLPFSDQDETVFRIMSLQLLRKYFLDPQSQISSCAEEVERLYAEIEKVNHAFIGRIRSYCDADADKNAVATLDAFVQLFPYQKAANFELLRKYF